MQMPTLDDTPYIIVDDRKIAPIYRGAISHSGRAELPSEDDRPFGVVDRVTLSQAALDACRYAQEAAGAGQSAACKQPPAVLLTESPHGSR
jgi:hypothetical protein